MSARANASNVHGLRALFFVPTLLVIGIIVAANKVALWLQCWAVFWLGVASVLWWPWPASAAVNTVCYLDLMMREEEDTLPPRDGARGRCAKPAQGGSEASDAVRSEKLESASTTWYV